MGKYCKKHNIECEAVAGGYFCRYCGRILKEEEVLLQKAIVPYAIKYDVNGGVGSIPTQEIKPGTPLTITTITPTRNGYEFLGWHTNQSAIVASHKPGFQCLPSDDVTFYAVWKKIETTAQKNKTTPESTAVKTTISAEKITQKTHTTYHTTNQNEGAKKPGCLTWIIIILLLGALFNMCDGRSETEKWEDSYRGAYEEYAKFYGWD